MKNKINILALFAIGALLAFKPNHQGLHIGEKAPDFNLKNIDGKMVSLASIKNTKGYMVIFTCNHCPFSVAYEDRIIELHKKFAPKGVPVVAINPNDEERQPEDSYENMIKRAKQKKFPFVYLHDETQQVARTYGAARTPHVFLLNSSLTTMYIGAIDDNHENAKEVNNKYLEVAVNQMLQNQPITQPETKAIGCTIKWKK
ncbi:MAG: thioredoxin family protein [Bacteroidia bacterium]